MRSKRDLYQVMRVIERRYGRIGETLLEYFLDHESIRTVEGLISYACDDDEEITRLEEKTQGVNLEASAFGAYVAFKDAAEAAGLDASKLWDQFSEASAYWGHNMDSWEEISRGTSLARVYEPAGQAYLSKLKTESA